MFGFLKRPSPEGIFNACLSEQADTAWDETARDGVITFGVIRTITFTDDMAHSTLLVPRDGNMVEVPCSSYIVPFRTPTGWRVAARRGLGGAVGEVGPSKLVGGTIDLKPGDPLHVVLKRNSELPSDIFPRTPDGWLAEMLGKFMPAKGYQMGDLYYFKGPWEFLTAR